MAAEDVALPKGEIGAGDDSVLGADGGAGAIRSTAPKSASALVAAKAVCAAARPARGAVAVIWVRLPATS